MIGLRGTGRTLYKVRIRLLAVQQFTNLGFRLFYFFEFPDSPQDPEFGAVWDPDSSGCSPIHCSARLFKLQSLCLKEYPFFTIAPKKDCSTR